MWWMFFTHLLYYSIGVVIKKFEITYLIVKLFVFVSVFVFVKVAQCYKWGRLSGNSYPNAAC